MKDSTSQTEKDQHLPKFAKRFANRVFVFGMVFWLFVIIYAIYRLYVPFHDYNVGNKEYQKTYYYYILIGTVFELLFCFGLGLKDRIRVNLSLVISTMGISIYAFESYLEFLYQPKELAAARLGIPFDSRTYKEAIQDLKGPGVNAYPNVLPSPFTESNGLESDKGKIFPLAGISNITTVFMNEGGYFPIIKMDEYGFNNPKGSYNTGKVDIVLTGDSFTEGVSVHSDENIGAVLRKSGFNVINLGKAANGPLIEYAALKEYAEQIKPKIVLWIFFMNDIADLQGEIKSPLLMRYINDDNFSQNLSSRQIEIDRTLVKYVNQKWTTNDSEREKMASHPLIKVLKLYNFRMLVYSKAQHPAPNFPNPLFEKIMEKGKELVSSWGGKLYHVYLPSLRERQGNDLNELHKYVLRVVSELDIPVIDTYKEVFASHADPYSLTPLRIGYHYNAEGYRLVAEAIARRLKEDGIMPSDLGKK